MKVKVDSTSEWGGSLAIARRHYLLEAFTQLDLMLANDDQINTSWEEEFESVVSFTFANPALACDIFSIALNRVTTAAIVPLKNKSDG